MRADDRQLSEYLKKEYSDLWNDLSRAYGFDERKEATCKFILEHAPPSALVLDCCAGNGYPYALNISGMRRLFCCDLSHRSMQACRIALHNRGQEARCVTSAVGALPFQDRSFDLVYCLRSSWFFTDFQGCLEDMVRILRPEGVLVLEVMNTSVPSELWGYLNHWIKVHLARMKRMLFRQSAGDLFVTYRPMFLPVLGRMLRTLGLRGRFFSWPGLKPYGRYVPVLSQFRDEHVMVVVSRN